MARMSAEKAADIRKRNNEISVCRVFQNVEGGEQDEQAIPNPVETFEQAFQVSASPSDRQSNLTSLTVSSLTESQFSST